MKSSKVLNAITLTCIYLSALLIPFFFLPFTSEIFEFNKHYVLAFLTLLGLILADIMYAVVDPRIRYE